jgi:hypothetical protein
MTHPATRKYILLFLFELSGMVLILWDGVPLFRHLIDLEQVGTLRDRILLTVAVLLIQTSYWTTLHRPPPFTLPHNPFLAHVVLFVSRLSFIFASGVFSVAVYRYSAPLDFTIEDFLIMMAVLFSVFCFSRHLEKLGTLMKP